MKTRSVQLFAVTPHHDARLDALQCVKALSKEFPQSRFDVCDDEGTWVITFDAPCMANGTVIDEESITYRKAFTKGFMASDQLWER